MAWLISSGASTRCFEDGVVGGAPRLVGFGA